MTHLSCVATLLLALSAQAVETNSHKARIAREVQGQLDTEKNQKNVQEFKRRAEGVAKGIEATTESLEYKIMKAAQKGDLAEVRRLRGQGADLNTMNGMVAPPLFAAASRGDVPMATYLVAEGARIELGEGAMARSALISAGDVFPNKDNSAMIRFLASKGANINYRFGGEFQSTGDPRKDAYLKDRHEKMRGDSPLMMAVRKNHLAHIRTLLSLHVDPNLYSMGSTPLQVAQRARRTEAAQLLIAAGAH